MKSNRRLFNTILAAIALVFMVAAWILFAPMEFGGQAAYVIVNGNSMEPGFNLGDLVILQRASDYQIGDIATYRHPEVGPIIHRIIARDGDRFVLQGDNNTWADSYRPTQIEMIGKFWLHVPVAGKIVERLRTPWIMALLAAFIGLIFMTSGTASQVRWQRRQGRKRQPVREQAQFISQLGEKKADLLFLLAAIAIGSLLLALFAFTRPLSRTVADEISYQQLGEFSYSAAAPPGIYRRDTVQTGEPVFRQLINQVTINFDYRLVSDMPGDFEGTYRLLAEIGHDNGWQWTVELQPETAFKGNTFSAVGTIDLAQLQALIDSVEQQTGLQRQQYTLAVGPEVKLTGTMAGQTLQDQFSPRLAFLLDELQLQLVGDVRASDDPLTPSQIGLLQRPQTKPNTISILGFQISVLTARLIAAVGLILSLGGSLALAVFAYRSRWADEAARIRSKYGSLLITVRDTNWLDRDSRVIEVSTIDDLAKIAERDGRMILHYVQGSLHHYFVQSDHVSYRYQYPEHHEADLAEMKADSSC